MRAFGAALGRDHPASGTASPTPTQRRFRYGVQVNSLGLTEAQPENNVQRIVLEMLGVTLSRDARARAVQLPAWNEALGLPRPWDQQWSLRMQQVLAFESDLLEYPDLFEGSHVMTALVDDHRRPVRRAELDRVLEMGGVVAAVESGYLKSALVASLAERRGRIESRRGRGGRRQPLHRDRAVAADRRRRRGDRAGRPGGRGRRRGGASATGAPRGTPATVAAALARLRAVAGGTRQPDGGHPGLRPRRA